MVVSGRKRVWQDMSTTGANNNNYLTSNQNHCDVKKVEPLELTKSANNVNPGLAKHHSPVSGGSHAFKKLLKKTRADFLGLKQGDGLKQELQNQNFDPAYAMMPPPPGAPVGGPHGIGPNPGELQS